ncbi:MAG: hypothetical protein K2X99_03655, partial [Gemmatimonadaceae bacterium]|nr:hypothetical protein [Gemmatimonadaceae bacterium]
GERFADFKIRIGAFGVGNGFAQGGKRPEFLVAFRALPVEAVRALDDARGAMPGARTRTVTREARPAHPVARTAPLFERVRAMLDRWPLDAPVCAVTVAITAIAPASAQQGDLLAPAWRDPEAADAAFERLRSTLGADAVVRAVAQDAHRVEAQGVWTALHDDVPHTRAVRERPTRTEVWGPALRLLGTPEPVDVDAPRGTPHAFWWRGARVTVARATGPARLSGEWWTDTPHARDHWRCECDEFGQDVLLYRSAAGSWCLQGWYD